MSEPPLPVHPIGVVRSPFSRKVDAPRQPRAAEGVEGRIELDPSLAHAVEDLDGFEHVWVLAWMDRVETFRPKVHPPRSETKRGVLATRSPHRPNPIALSVMRLLRVEGTVLFVSGVDLLDGTPVLDVKPYIPWTDAIPRSRVGWLEAEAPAMTAEDRPEDPQGSFVVTVEPRATAQLAWLGSRGVELEPTLRTILETSPHPRPYRRIRPDRHEIGGFVLAISEWRVAFRLEDRRVTVWEIRSGYRPSERAAHPLHADYVEALGA
ncbi:MAG: tRNA (N6-threonylcarbamoyladenosine(37)-N6)-methyltransferase TrmO [Sandaracinaceae bacterium]|nr:tRNA (N6-threonylcarbamoyladenosine(37)-N6)-methyltransferase TrmO [Sandaracinaceae bacterium]